MKTGWIFFDTIVLMCLVVTLRAEPAPATQPMEFTVQPVVRPFVLSEYRGQYVAVHFLLKTECPYCLRHTNEFATRAGEMPGVIQLFLKPDDPATIAKWSAKLKVGGADLPMIYRDPGAKLAKAMAIPDGYKFHGESVHYPAMVLIGPGGTEVFRYVGKDNADRMSFDALIAKLAELKEKGS